MSKGIIVPELPTHWDYNKQKLYLTRGQKTKMQLALSKMDKRKIKKQIEFLKQMESEKSKEFKKRFGASKGIILPDYLEKQKQELWKWVVYCRETAKFADYYLRSLEHRKKI